MRKLFLKIKRFFFYRLTGLKPEELKRLLYVQKYLEKRQHNYKRYNDYIKENFKNESL